MRKICPLAAALFLLFATAVGGTIESSRPELPPEAQGEQVVAVARLDLDRVAIGEIDATLAALLGTDAPAMARHTRWLAEHRQDLVRAGARTICCVLCGQDARGRMPAATYLVAARPGVDQRPLRNHLEELVGAEGRYLIAPKRGDWLFVLPRRDEPFLAKGDAARRKRFSDALSHADDAALRAVFVPNRILREEAHQSLKEAPAYLAPFAPILRQVVDAPSCTLWFEFGEEPAMRAVVEFGDERAAQAFARELQSIVAAARQTVAKIDRQPKRDLGQGEQVMLSTFRLVSHIDVGSEKTRVALALEGDGLAFAARLIARRVESISSEYRDAVATIRAQQIIAALHAYAAEHEGKAPNDLSALVAGGYLDASVLSNPRSEERPGFRLVGSAAGQALPQPSEGSRTAVVTDAHAASRRLTGYADGRVVIEDEP